MKCNTRWYGRARASRRARVCHPQIETMEGRLSLGDALLGPVLGASWLASTLAVLDPGSAAAESAAGRPAHRGPAPEGAGAQAAPAFAFLGEARAALGPPATGTLAGPGVRTSWEAASDPWPEWATLAALVTSSARLSSRDSSHSGPMEHEGSGAAPVSQEQATPHAFGPTQSAMLAPTIGHGTANPAESNPLGPSNSAGPEGPDCQANAPHYSYRFRKIADNGPGSPYADVTGQGINDQQDIVFTATLREGGQAIYQTDKHGRHLTTIAKSGALIRTFTQLPFINNRGQVSFAAQLQNGATAIFRAEVEGDEDGEDGGGKRRLTRIADTEPGSLFSSLPPPAAKIRANGKVVFWGTLRETNQVGYFSGDGDTLETLYLTGGGEFTAFASTPSVQINGDMLGFRAILPDGRMGAFTGNGRDTRTLAVTGAEFATFAAVEINDCGTNPLTATLTKGGQVLYVIKTDGNLVPFVDTTGGYATLASRPGGVSINNDGAIMFMATLDEGGEGIFQGPDVVADKVIKTGDELFDSRVTSFAAIPMNPRGMNANGWLIFRVGLADGRTVIGLGKPRQDD